jgi:hypothetical protein
MVREGSAEWNENENEVVATRRDVDATYTY